MLLVPVTTRGIKIHTTVPVIVLELFLRPFCGADILRGDHRQERRMWPGAYLDISPAELTQEQQVPMVFLLWGRSPWEVTSAPAVWLCMALGV